VLNLTDIFKIFTMSLTYLSALYKVFEINLVGFLYTLLSGSNVMLSYLEYQDEWMKTFPAMFYVLFYKTKHKPQICSKPYLSIIYVLTSTFTSIFCLFLCYFNGIIHYLLSLLFQFCHCPHFVSLQ
jgi:hypothetical protein